MCGLALAACGDDEAETAQQNLIPRTLLFSGTGVRDLKLSPDARYISYIADDQGAPNIWIAPVDAPRNARPLTEMRAGGVLSHAWHPAGHYLLYLGSREGGDDIQAFAISADGAQNRNLTPMTGIQAQFLATSKTDPLNVYVAINDRNPALPDIYRVNMKSGARLLMAQNDGAAGYLAGPDLNPLLAQSQNPDGGYEWRVQDGADWRPLARVGPDDMLTTLMDSLAPERGEAILRDSRGHGETGLSALSLVDGKTKTIARVEKHDIDMVVYDPETGAPVAYRIAAARKTWTGLTDAAKQSLERLKLLAPGDFDIIDQSADGQQWLVAFDDSGAPPVYFLFDREAQAGARIDLNDPAWQVQKTAQMRPVEIGGEGVAAMTGYLSLPIDRKLGPAGRPDRPAPLVLVVHGGPWSRDYWGFSKVHQWLASRGYAALSVNYRGSSGSGKAYLAAADRSWGPVAKQDLLRAAEWAKAQGIARTGKIGLFGGSFGGYAALYALAQAPEAFACAVSLSGPVDLNALAATMSQAPAPISALFRERLGDPANESDRERLRAQSPLDMGGAFKKPVLIAGGAADPQVSIGSLADFAALLSAKNKPIAFLRFGGEQHGLRRPENERAFFAAAEAFYNRCLGGVLEPLTAEDVMGSTAELAVGGDLLPGFKAALKARQAALDEAVRGDAPS